MKKLIPVFLLSSCLSSVAQANEYNYDLSFGFEDINNSINEQSLFMLVHLTEPMANTGPLGQRNFLTKSDFIVASRSHYSYSATDNRSHAVDQHMEYGWEVAANKYLSIAYIDSMLHYKPSQNWAPTSSQGYSLTFAEYLDDYTAYGISYDYTQDHRANDGNLLRGFYNKLIATDTGTYWKINTNVSTTKYASASTKVDSNRLYLGAIYYPTVDWGFGLSASTVHYDDDTSNYNYDVSLSHFFSDSTYMGLWYRHIIPTSGSSYPVYQLRLGKRF